jgi:hypothetical protein
MDQTKGTKGKKKEKPLPNQQQKHPRTFMVWHETPAYRMSQPGEKLKGGATEPSARD